VVEASIGFMMSPKYHPSMKIVAPVRKRLKVKTVFNILGPMLNPAQVPYAVVGVYNENIVSVYPISYYSFFLLINFSLYIFCSVIIYTILDYFTLSFYSLSFTIYNQILLFTILQVTRNDERFEFLSFYSNNIEIMNTNPNSY